MSNTTTTQSKPTKGFPNWHASAESLLGLTPKRLGGVGEYFVTLSAEHREAGDVGGIPIRVHFGEGLLTVEKTDSRPEWLTAEVLEAVQDAGETGITRSNIAESVGKNRQDVLKTVAAAIKAGRLVVHPEDTEKKRGERYVVGEIKDDNDDPPADGEEPGDLV